MVAFQTCALLFIIDAIIAMVVRIIPGYDAMEIHKLAPSLHYEYKRLWLLFCLQNDIPAGS